MAHKVVEESHVVSLPAGETFRRTMAISLPELFPRRRGVFPPVKEVRAQTGEWDAAGQTRTVVLADGGSFREELTSVDPPRSFGYLLTEIAGPLGLLVGHVVGDWIFTPAAGGTEITWRWHIHSKSPLTSWLLPLFARLWKGYARQALRDLSAALTA